MSTRFISACMPYMLWYVGIVSDYLFRQGGSIAHSVNGRSSHPMQLYSKRRHLPLTIIISSHTIHESGHHVLKFEFQI
jgi:hypothetical protein